MKAWALPQDLAEVALQGLMIGYRIKLSPLFSKPLPSPDEIFEEMSIDSDYKRVDGYANKET
jgi:hypothetical protein